MSCVGLLYFSSCSLLIHPDRDQCSVDADCLALGLQGKCSAGLCIPPVCKGEPGCQFESDPTVECGADRECGDSPARSCWRGHCVAQVQVEPFECTAETPVRMTEVPFTTHVREAGSPRAPKGLVVKACRASDLECSDPYKAVEDIAGNGEITLLLPWGFSGYLEFSSNGMLGLLYYMSRPVTEPIETESMSLLTPEERAATAMISRQPVDLEKTGMVLAQMHDCSGTPAPGVRFEIDKPRPRPYFVVDGEPSADADVSVFDPDRREAQGGFLNVEPGVALVRARLGLDGPILGQANLLVRPKTITQLEIFPYLQ